MTRIQRHALVMHSASRMFHLVNEVEAYPRHFGWCEQATVLERDGGGMVARLDLRIAGLRTHFTTRNRWIEPTRLDLELVDGPFRKLEGHWTFHALLGGALSLGFQGLADRLVDDFCRIANAEDRALR